MLLPVSLITYYWLTTIEKPAPISPKICQEDSAHDIQGSDFESKVNLFPMVAN
jgi:hypothetical protein